MEVLLVSGFLAFLGHGLNQSRAKEQTETLTSGLDREKSMNSASMSHMRAAEYAKHNIEAVPPNWHNNMSPHFGGNMKTRDDLQSQRKLERFTGTGDGAGTFQPKPDKEVQPLSLAETRDPVKANNFIDPNVVNQLKQGLSSRVAGLLIDQESHDEAMRTGALHSPATVVQRLDLPSRRLDNPRPELHFEATHDNYGTLRDPVHAANKNYVHCSTKHALRGPRNPGDNVNSILAAGPTALTKATGKETGHVYLSNGTKTAEGVQRLYTSIIPTDQRSHLTTVEHQVRKNDLLPPSNQYDSNKRRVTRHVPLASVDEDLPQPRRNELLESLGYKSARPQTKVSSMSIGMVPLADQDRVTNDRAPALGRLLRGGDARADMGQARLQADNLMPVRDGLRGSRIKAPIVNEALRDLRLSDKRDHLGRIPAERGPSITPHADAMGHMGLVEDVAQSRSPLPTREAELHPPIMTAAVYQVPIKVDLRDAQGAPRPLRNEGLPRSQSLGILE